MLQPLTRLIRSSPLIFKALPNILILPGLNGPLNIPTLFQGFNGHLLARVLAPLRLSV